MKSLLFCLMLAVCVLRIAEASFADDAELPEHAVARLGGYAYRHTGPISSLQVSREGRLFAIRGWDEAVRVFNRAGEEVALLPTEDCRSIRFAPDVQELAMLQQDGTCEVWDYVHLQRIQTYDPGDREMQWMDYLSTGELIGLVPATENDRTIIRLDDMAEIATGPFRGPLAVADDGHRIITAGPNGQVSVWNAGEPAPLVSRTFDTNSIPKLAFTPDTTPLALGTNIRNGNRKYTAVWNVESGEALFRIDHAEFVDCLALSSDGSHIVLAFRGEEPTVRVYNVAPQEEVFRTEWPYRGSADAMISHDGTTLVIQDGGYGQAVALWDLSMGTRIDGTMGHRASVHSIAWSPDGEQIASTGSDNTVRIWNIAEQSETAELSDWSPDGDSVAFSPDGQLVAATAGGFYRGPPSAVVVWSTGQQIPVNLLPTAYIQEARMLGFSGDGQYLACVAHRPRGGWAIAQSEGVRYAGSIEVWNLNDLNGFPFQETAEAIGSFEWTRTVARTSRFHIRGELSEHHSDVYSVAFSPNGSLLATAGEYRGDGEILIWELPEGRRVRRVLVDESPLGAITFSPDGKLVAAIDVSDESLFGGWQRVFAGTGRATSSIWIWNVDDGSEATTLRTDDEILPIDIAFSHNGRHLAAGMSDGTIVIWDIEQQQIVHTLNGHRSAVNCVEFSPDGERLASGSADTTILIWDYAAIRESFEAPN